MSSILEIAEKQLISKTVSQAWLVSHVILRYTKKKCGNYVLTVVDCKLGAKSGKGMNCTYRQSFFMKYKCWQAYEGYACKKTNHAKQYFTMTFEYNLTFISFVTFECILR